MTNLDSYDEVRTFLSRIKTDNSRKEEIIAPKYSVVWREMIVDVFEESDASIPLNERLEMKLESTNLFDLRFLYNYHIDTLSLALPPNGLYLTKEIEVILSEFLCGRKSDGMYWRENLNEDNLKALRQYIPVNYDHWGGYWHFTSFPSVIGALSMGDFFNLEYRISWCEGCSLWFRRYESVYVMIPTVYNQWIE